MSYVSAAGPYSSQRGLTLMTSVWIIHSQALLLLLLVVVAKLGSFMQRDTTPLCLVFSVLPACAEADYRVGSKTATQSGPFKRFGAGQ